MAEPRRILLPLAAVARATVFAAIEQTSASLFPTTLSFLTAHPLVLEDDNRSAGDALARALADADLVAGPWQYEGSFEQFGRASWYGSWHHGRTTASGEKFDMNKLTAAHRTLPLGTKVRVTNLDNYRSVDVTINDRGPYVDRRVIDLSREAARQLRMEHQGLAPVLVEEMRPDSVRSALVE
jgi:rare lipoprotein A